MQYLAREISPGPSPDNLLARKLGCFTEFTADEHAALERLWHGQRKLVPPHQDIAREGERPGCVRLMLGGWACRYKTLPDGRRQILGFIVPGDLCDLNSLVLLRLDHSVLAVTPVRYVSISTAQLDKLTERRPNIRRAFHWDCLVNAAIQREWTVNLGKRSALERLAHLLCELFVRLRVVGLTRNTMCSLPVTQIELADALGISPVHINRTLRELRDRQLVVLQDRQLVLPDFEGLRALALFDPAYLHLAERQQGHTLS